MEALKPCPTCGRFYKNAPSADPRPAAQPGVVKALERARLTMERYRRAGLGDDVFHADLCESIEAADAALAAPVSQEPVARSDVFDWLETELRAVDCRYRGDPAYDHDAYWFRDRALNVVAKAREIFASPQPLTGELSEAEVERAAKAAYEKFIEDVRDLEPSWEALSQSHRDRMIGSQRAALLAAKSKGGQADG